MKKYLVKTFNVETKNGRDCLNKFLNSTNQDTDFEAGFDTLDKAKKYYETVKSGVKYMSNYYLHYCKVIEDAETGEWLECKAPDKE